MHPKKIDVINSRCADLLIKYDLKGIKELKYHGLIPKKGCIGNMEKSAMMHDILSIVISEKLPVHVIISEKKGLFLAGIFLLNPCTCLQLGISYIACLSLYTSCLHPTFTRHVWQYILMIRTCSYGMV
ncbi:hypothetical protein IBTHAUMO2_170037 [Nitrosopumilaceae archaeon]|nr:hypothetical protein IBTHAUMO2_170037 [Nitrosopumilaceae archaeon]